MFACLEDAPEAVIFNDVRTHDVFIQQHPDYTGAKIQIMHNNGEFGKMLLEAIRMLIASGLHLSRLK